MRGFVYGFIALAIMGLFAFMEYLTFKAEEGIEEKEKYPFGKGFTNEQFKNNKYYEQNQDRRSR